MKQYRQCYERIFWRLTVRLNSGFAAYLAVRSLASYLVSLLLSLLFGKE